MVEILVILCVDSPVGDPDNTAHVLCGTRVKQPQTEYRVGFVRQTQGEPGMLFLQRRLLFLDKRVVSCESNDRSVCFL